MSQPFLVRPARPGDAVAMARVHVTSWQEIYRGLMHDGILDDPSARAGRERFWTSVLTDPEYAQNRSAVAEIAGSIVGIAMSAPGESTRQLNVLYLLTAHHGCGAGTDLLTAVLDPDEPAVLWVADPNPRAQAFYRKHGFSPDGPTRVEDGVTEIHMSRPGDARSTDPQAARP